MPPARPLRISLLTMPCLCLLLLMMVGSPSLSYAAELYYQETAQTVGGLTTRLLTITARHDDEPLWRMVVNLGRSDGHTHYTPGTISSFTDLQWPTPAGVAPFEYASQILGSRKFGLLRFSSMAGAFSDQGGRLPQAYRFSVTNVVRLGLTVVLNVVIHAPLVEQAGGYRTDIEATCTVFNARSDSAEIAPLGLQNMNLNLNAAGLFDGVIVNPIDATVKPVLHDVIPIDGHPLYIIEDWYGDINRLFDGPMIRMTVRDAPLARSLAMRPGLSFEVSAPEMSLADVKATGLLAGETVISESQDIHGRLLDNRLRNPIASMTHVPAGGQVTIAYQGSINAPPPKTKSDSSLDVEVHLSSGFVYQNNNTTQYRHHVVLTAQVHNEAGDETYAVEISNMTNDAMFTVAAGASNLQKHLVGGTRNVAPFGNCEFVVTVTDSLGRTSGPVNASLMIRQLGDIDGSGGLDGLDKSLMNDRLNGLNVGEVPDAAFDLDGSGGLPDGLDKGLLNDILNGVTIN